MNRAIGATALLAISLGVGAAIESSLRSLPVKQGASDLLSLGLSAQGAGDAWASVWLVDPVDHASSIRRPARAQIKQDGGRTSLPLQVNSQKREMQAPPALTQFAGVRK